MAHARVRNATSFSRKLTARIYCGVGWNPARRLPTGAFACLRLLPGGSTVRPTTYTDFLSPGEVSGATHERVRHIARWSVRKAAYSVSVSTVRPNQVFDRLISSLLMREARRSAGRACPARCVEVRIKRSKT